MTETQRNMIEREREREKEKTNGIHKWYTQNYNLVYYVTKVSDI